MKKNEKKQCGLSMLAAMLVALPLALPFEAVAATKEDILPSSKPASKPAARPAAQAANPLRAGLMPCNGISMVAPATITLGKSTLIRLPTPAVRLVVGGLPSGYAGKPVDNDVAKGPPKAAAAAGEGGHTGVADVDVLLLSPSELYLLGKHVGSMNLILQNVSGQCTVMDVAVSMDAASLQAKLGQMFPDEKSIKVTAAEDTLILSGEVSDALKVERAMTLAAAYVADKKVVNLLRTGGVQQVMLEVKVAEISKTLLDQLGASVSLTRTQGGVSYLPLVSDFLTKGGGVLNFLKPGRSLLKINGEKDDGVVRVLAEPNIMAISGQQASFLSGGKIFIPVAQTNSGGFGGVTITLEEKEFGVGVKFTPTVLDGGRINLKVASEVSELSQTGSPFTTVDNVTAILPSFTTRRADTTVQLMDGQSFAIAGLIKNNMTESVKRFPGLGELPVLGALFRSTEFQKDMTELMFIITPRLVKPLPPNYALPTDGFTEPGRTEFMLGAAMEGKKEAAASTKAAPAPTAAPAPAGGFEIK